MDTPGKMTKRTFMKTALGVGGLGVSAKMLGGFLSPREAYAQLLESGIEEKSVLARIKKEGVLRVGFSQTMPMFQRDAKTNTLAGIYHDVCEELVKQLEIKSVYQEVSWANATIGLRKGDFDLFGSSLMYSVPRALVVSYVKPMWYKGHLAVCHKDNAHRFKSTEDFNRPDVTFSVSVGTREENLIKNLFPKAKIIVTSGQIVLGAEPVRTKKADLFANGDIDATIFAKKNSSWAHLIDPQHPFGRAGTAWAIRYGDASWKFFLDMWADYMIVSGFVQERYDYYKEMLAGS